MGLMGAMGEMEARLIVFGFIWLYLPLLAQE
jgi:hypothetical protein